MAPQHYSKATRDGWDLNISIGVGFRQRAVRTVITVTKTFLLLQAQARRHEQLVLPSHVQVWLALKK